MPSSGSIRTLPRLSPAATAFIRDQSNTLLLSNVSVWEIVIKQNLGKLTLHQPLETIVADQQRNGVAVLPIQVEHVLALQRLQPIHRDPFDRLIIAQAIQEGAVIITSDRQFEHYPVNVIW